MRTGLKLLIADCRLPIASPAGHAARSTLHAPRSPLPAPRSTPPAPRFAFPLSRFPAFRFRATSAFSLVEILIVVALLSVIMLGLLMMFNQTQRVFRTSMTQVDVLEAGRAVASMIAADVEQMKPAYGSTNNFFVGRFTGLPSRFHLPQSETKLRTNILQDMFFLTRENQTWKGIGYFVRNEENGRFRMPQMDVGGGQLQNSVGRLYRFEKSISAASVGVREFQNAPEVLWRDFLAVAGQGATITNSARLADGIVHFRVRPYDLNGHWVTNTFGNVVLVPRFGPPFPFGEVTTYTFTSNAVPAAVEIEIGMLEDRTFEQYKSLPAGAPRYNYLTNRIGSVHIFRQRVPVRNVDRSAYQ